ncbi:MAG TPA: methyltransferase domain-containing protein [Candidatus Limnocylindrales bacterium]
MDCCTPGGDPSYDRQFDARHAADKLRDYRQKGPVAMTRQLIDALAEGGVDGRTVLDIGAGVGAVHLELLRDGAERAVDVDFSGPYIAAAKEEAVRQGRADRVRYVAGDFVAVADEIETADIVALDRVICCYPDMVALVGRSVSRARYRYGLVYPRDTLLGRIGIGFFNLSQRLSRSSFRAYVHPTAEVDALVAAQGLVARFRRSNLFWQVAVYERPG